MSRHGKELRVALGHGLCVNPSLSIHNTHLDFCTASNVHKNILAVMLTSISSCIGLRGLGWQNRRNPGAASHAATPVILHSYMWTMVIFFVLKNVS